MVKSSGTINVINEVVSTISSTAINIADTPSIIGLTIAELEYVDILEFYVGSNPVRYTTSGTTATTSTGKVADSELVTIKGNHNIKELSIITESTDSDVFFIVQSFSITRETFIS